MTTAEIETKIIEKEEQQQEPEVSSAPSNTSESFLTVLEKGQKSWFLSTTEIYKLTKGAVKLIPRSSELFEQSLHAIALVTKYVNESTRVNVVFNVDQTYDLITKLDDLLSEQLVVVDDGLDSLRGKLTASLKGLIGALVQHKEWAETFAKQQQDNATQLVATQYDHALLVLKLLKDTAEAKFPKVTKLATETVDRVKATIDTSKQLYHGEVPAFLREYAQHLLNTAQPYVHNAVNYSLPVVQKAVDVSHPYYDKAAPYVITPVLEKALSIEASWRESPQYGPYVTKAVDTSAYLWNELLNYATPKVAVTD